MTGKVHDKLKSFGYATKKMGEYFFKPCYSLAKNDMDISDVAIFYGPLTRNIAIAAGIEIIKCLETGKPPDLQLSAFNLALVLEGFTEGMIVSGLYALKTKIKGNP
jgi:hypothetical protein